MTLKTFKRYEKKFLLNENQYNEMLKRLPLNMTPDKNSRQDACYSIHNIYYDTVNNDIIRNSISHPYYKEKLRLRSYTVPVSPDDIVFLEFKKKIGGIVSKRRATMTLQDAYHFIETGTKPEMTGYMNNIVIEEIAQFLKNNKVEPKVLISYDRKAFFGKTDKSIRITIDKNIRTRRVDVALEKGAHGKLLLDNNPFLMEIKFSQAMPLWFTGILSELKIYNTSFSKYGTEYRNYLLEDLHQRRRSTRYFPIYEKSPATLAPCINQ